jgi:hypothetical protein
MIKKSSCDYGIGIGVKGIATDSQIIDKFLRISGIKKFLGITILAFPETENG